MNKTNLGVFFQTSFHRLLVSKLNISQSRFASKWKEHIDPSDLREK